MVKPFFTILFLNFFSLAVNGQILPPGLGDIHYSSWLAFGINQDLDKQKENGWRSSSYIGIAGQSNPDTDNPFKNPGVFIVNQEFYNRFYQNWEYSLALSYRRQHLYEKVFPFDRVVPSAKNEFRFYSRFSYLHKTDWVEITPTLRQEIAKYFTPDFKDYPENWRMRTRFRLKFRFPLNSAKTQSLLLYSEQLFSISQHAETKKWDRFKYKDSRFSAYYSLSPVWIPFTFNAGYMLNLVGSKSTYTGHYFALDVIWKNPFR